MEPEGSLPHSQVPATCPYPEPARWTPCPPHPTAWKSILISSSHLCPGLPIGIFPSGFPTKTLYTPLLSPIRATCPAHLIIFDLITWTILGEKYRSLSSSLCNFLHSHVTSSVLGPNILLNSLFIHVSLLDNKRYKQVRLWFAVHILTCERNCSTHIGPVLRNLPLGIRKATKKNLSVQSMKRTRSEPDINRKQMMGFRGATDDQLAYPNYIVADSVFLTMINELNSN